MPLNLGWLQRLSWQTVATALVAGGIIHISATLVIPQFAKASAFQRLTASMPANRMRLLPVTTPENQLLPIQGPDDRLAICRYDLSAGPVEVSAVLPDKGWTLGFYTPDGDNFYVIPAQEFRRSEITLTLVPATDRLFGLFSMFGFGRTTDTTVSHVTVPLPQGLIVVRAPVRGRAFAADTEAQLSRAQCGTKRL